MALDIPALVKGALDGFTGTLAADERAHVMLQVEETERLAGKDPTVDDLKGAVGRGWHPEFYMGAKVNLVISGQVATTRKKTVGADGKISWGPLQLGVTFGDETDQQQASAISGTIELVRTNVATQMDLWAATLGGTAPTPPAPPPLPTPPPVPHA